MSEMIETEDVDAEQATAADLVGEEEISFDFQSVLDNLQNLWASDYARALLRDSQVLAQNGSLKRLLAEARQLNKAHEAVIEQLLQEKDLSSHAEEALAEDSAHLDGFLSAPR